MPQNKNNAPIDYIYGAGIAGSLAIGGAGVLYCTLSGRNIESIKKPIKYAFLSFGTLGGAGCGAAIGGLGGYILSTIGTSGDTSNESAEIIRGFTLKYAAFGGIIGGVGGSLFGIAANECLYPASKAIINNVPKPIIPGAAALATGVGVTYCYNLFADNSSPSTEEEEIDVAVVGESS